MKRLIIVIGLLALLSLTACSSYQNCMTDCISLTRETYNCSHNLGDENNCWSDTNYHVMEKICFDKCRGLN